MLRCFSPPRGIFWSLAEYDVIFGSWKAAQFQSPSGDFLVASFGGRFGGIGCSEFQSPSGDFLVASQRRLATVRQRRPMEFQSPSGDFLVARHHTRDATLLASV